MRQATVLAEAGAPDGTYVEDKGAAVAVHTRRTADPQAALDLVRGPLGVLAEQTGLVVEPGTLVGTVRRGPYLIADYRCAVVGGTLRAGDDATDARWCDAATLASLPLVPLLYDTLREWDALPR